MKKMTVKSLIVTLFFVLPLGAFAQGQNNLPPYLDPGSWGDSYTPVPGAHPGPDSKINRVWTEHNQMVGGKTGMLIHVTIFIPNTEIHTPATQSDFQFRVGIVDPSNGFDYLAYSGFYKFSRRPR